MFGTIRRHQTWLWAVIITLTIISFLVFFTPTAKMGNGASRNNFGSLYGKSITQDEYIAARKEVLLSYFFMTGNWPDDESKRRGYDPDMEAYKWLLLIQKQEQMGIHVSAESGADAARERLAPLQRNGTSPDKFVTQVLVPRGFTLDDFERYMRHFIGIQELIGTFGLSGKLITPGEASSIYEREHQDLATEAVFFSVSNYLSTVAAKPEALTQFYSNNLPNYRLPDRVQVSYAKFGISNYLAQAETDLKTNLNDLVESNFQRLGTNYTRLGKTPELARTKLREEILHERALNQAMSDARSFARPLVEKPKAAPADLAAAVKQSKALLGETKPFDLEEGPGEIDGNADFAKAAFALNQTHPIFGPIPARDGAYVIALSTNIPSENPPFELVKEKVSTDYKMDQARSESRLAGVAFASSVTNGMAQGKSFAELATQAKVKAVELPPFSLSSRSVPVAEEHISVDQLRNIAFTTKPGKVSRFEPTLDGGIVLFVKSRVKLDEAKMRAELPAFMASVRQTRENQAFNEWFHKEMEHGARDTPLMQKQTPSPSMSSRGVKK